MDIKQQLANAGIKTEDHWGGKVYAMVSHIPAGRALTQHIHPFEHLSWLSAGTVRIKVDDIETVEVGPIMLTIPAHKQHEVIAVTDVIWLCLWGEGVIDEATQ